MKLILARHAETGGKYSGRYVGSTDVSISSKGEADAASLAKRLKKYNIDCCISSPMLRTRQTAELICGHCNLSYKQNDLLKEIDFGLWECLSFDEISSRYPNEVEQWSLQKEKFQFPEGELTSSFYERIEEVAKIISNYEAENILVVAHGGVIRALICVFLGLSFDSYLLFNVKPAKFAVLEVFGERGILSGLNL